MRVSAPVVGVLLLASLACGRWAGTDDFIGRLRCGMTPAEIRAVTADFPQVVLDQRSSHLLTADRSGTVVFMHLDSERRLEAVQHSWISGYTRATVSLKRDLCRELDLVELNVSAWRSEGTAAGAVVFLDGAPVAQLSGPHGQAKLDVAVGNHSLRIEKCGFVPWTIDLSLEASGGGHRSVDVPKLTPMPPGVEGCSPEAGGGI